jgi:hypothetical protein
MPSLECKHPTCSGETCRRPKKEKKVYQLKRTPLVKKPYKIKKVSEKRKYNLKQYLEDRIVFLKANPICQANLDCCKKKATEVHHAAGRENDRLNDQSFWVAICRPCHRWVTENSAEAIELGLSVRRVT